MKLQRSETRVQIDLKEKRARVIIPTRYRDYVRAYARYIVKSLKIVKHLTYLWIVCGDPKQTRGSIRASLSTKKSTSRARLLLRPSLAFVIISGRDPSVDPALPDEDSES